MNNQDETYPIQSNQNSLFVAELSQKYPSWISTQITIILKQLKQNTSISSSDILKKLQEIGSDKSLESIQEFLEISKQENWLGIYTNKTISLTQQPKTYDSGRADRTTAAMAKKFINEYANNHILKSQKKKKMMITEQDIPKKKRTQQSKQHKDHNKQKNQQKQHKIVSNSQHFKSKRKIMPSDSILIPSNINHEDHFANLQSINRNCQSYLAKKINKKNSTSSNNFGNLPLHSNRNIEYEFFYTNYDKPYFLQNIFRQMLDYAKFQKIMTYQKYRYIRYLMGKPRLFSISQITNEKANLQYYRNCIRNYIKTQNSKQIQQNLPNNTQNIKNVVPLCVGQQVIAPHPICGHLHTGSILALYKQNLIMVKFHNLQLGVQKILDNCISSEYVSKRPEIQRNLSLQKYQSTQNMINNNNANKPNEIIQNIDYYSMACYLKILQYKSQLIIQMQDANNQLENYYKTNLNAQIQIFQLQQKYGWIASIINLINLSLRHIISKFRLRGVMNYNRDQLGKNFSKLLVNPLNVMEKQLQIPIGSQNNSLSNSINTNNDALDIHAVKQIKQIISFHQEIRVQDTVQKICNRIKQQKHINLMSLQSQYEDLVKNFISILVILRTEGKISNISDNKFMKKIAIQLNQQNNHKLSQIGDLIYAISSK